MRKFVVAVAISAFLCSLLVTPATADANFSEGVAAYHQGKFQEAFEKLEKAIDKEPNNPEAYYYMAVTCQQLRKFVEARGYFQFIVQNFPKSKVHTLATKGFTSLANVRAPITPAPPRVVSTPSNSPQNYVIANTVSPSGSKVNVYGRSKVEAQPGEDVIPDDERIPFTREHKCLMVNGWVNGKQMRMLIDTGAYKATFDKGHLKQLGLKLPEGKASGQAYGAAGAHDIWEMDIDISLGRIKVRMPINVIEEMGGEPILGQTFLSKMNYQIDNSANYIKFSNKSRKVANEPTYNSIDVPFRMVNNNMIVEGKVNGIPCEMNFDTGASKCAFSIYDSRRLGYFKAVSEVSVEYANAVGGIAKNYAFNIDCIELGPIKKVNVPVWLSEEYAGYPLIGQSFFGDSKFVVDQEKKVIHFWR